MELYFESKFSVYFKDVKTSIERSFINLNHELIYNNAANNEAIYRIKTNNDVFFFILTCPHAKISRDAHFKYKIEINSNNNCFDCFSFREGLKKIRQSMSTLQLKEIKKMAIF